MSVPHPFSFRFLSLSVPGSCSFFSHLFELNLDTCCGDADMQSYSYMCRFQRGLKMWF